MRALKAAFVLLLGAFVLFPNQVFAQQNSITQRDSLEIINKYLNLMERRSNDTTFNRAQCRSKIEGLDVSSCDRYSAIFDEEDIKNFKKRMGRDYYGVGMSIAKTKDDKIVVTRAFPGFPADSAGLRPGDVITRVDTLAIDSTYTVEEVVTAITGPQNTQVTLFVKRGGKSVGPLIVTREKVHAPSVSIDTIGSSVGYIRISSFTDSLPGEMDSALDSLSMLSVDKFILDVRDNPGGSLQSVVEVLNREFSSGPRLRSVTVMSRGKEEDVYRTSVRGEYANSSLVVLVNGWSASASEIMSGTLKDWDRAEVVGDTTFGKGSVQAIFYHRTRSGNLFWIKLTTAEYFVGNSLTKINGVGVVPDYVVDDSLVDRDSYYTQYGNLKIDLKNDPQLKKAVEVLKGKIKP